MDWPGRSPDLNPIDHVWDFLGRRLAARTLPTVTIPELRLALQYEWAAIPQQLIPVSRCHLIDAQRCRGHHLEVGYFGPSRRSSANPQGCPGSVRETPHVYRVTCNNINVIRGTKSISNINDDSKRRRSSEKNHRYNELLS
ncbi:transposable element Tcb2 transposase [Trichonephila clavipes]|nr:transposable element Tcb2 transposase [Trichonephila clavipes]